jgi:hypothetical protein
MALGRRFNIHVNPGVFLAWSRSCRGMITALGLTVVLTTGSDLYAQTFRSQRRFYAPHPPGYAPSQSYRPAPSYRPSRIYRPSPNYVPRTTYRPSPNYVPRATYRPSPNYVPRATYQPSPNYVPRTTYQPSPSYVPRTTYRPSPSYVPRTTYRPSPSYVPRTTYQPSPSYVPRTTYQPSPSYVPRTTYQPLPNRPSQSSSTSLSSEQLAKNARESNRRLEDLAGSGVSTIRSKNPIRLIWNGSRFVRGIIREMPYVANPQNYGRNYPQVPVNASSGPAPRR